MRPRCRPQVSMTVLRAAIAGAAAILSAFLAAQPAAAAGRTAFAVPVDCDLASLCSIQNYLDVDSGPGATDYRCGTLTYDGHQGTDFQLPDLATMRRGIAVLAAAPGTVRAVRDGVPDLGYEEWQRSGSDTTALGNAIAIVHADGSEALYGHLRQGSVTVRTGEQVVAGQRLGFVGLSGKTQFPHLHFQVMRSGIAVDPFTGHAASSNGCSVSAAPLWRPAALAQFSYRPAVLVCGGFALAVPDRKAIRETCPALYVASPDSAALLLFAEIAGVQAGDRLRLVIRAPDGSALVDDLTTIDRSRARRFRYVGQKRPTPAWPAGNYTAQIELVRPGAAEPLVDAQHMLEIR
jgi:murein DD-endopeptidase MepM/ murein hydrolase activator NlpD